MPDPPLDELAALLLAEHDGPGRRARGEPFGGEHRRRHPGAEVALEHVAVERVDAVRDAGRGRGQPAQQPRLGLVGVDDVGPVRAHEPRQRGERAGVVGRADRPAERREVARRHVELAEVHLGLPLLDRAVHEQRLPALAGEPAVEQLDVGRRPADREPGDHPQDAAAHQAPGLGARSSWSTVSRASRRYCGQVRGEPPLERRLARDPAGPRPLDGGAEARRGAAASQPRRTAGLPPGAPAGAGPRLTAAASSARSAATTRSLAPISSSQPGRAQRSPAGRGRASGPRRRAPPSGAGCRPSRTGSPPAPGTAGRWRPGAAPCPTAGGPASCRSRSSSARSSSGATTSRSVCLTRL